MINSDFISNIFDRACETQRKEEFGLLTFFSGDTIFTLGSDVNYFNPTNSSLQPSCHEFPHVIQQK